MGHLPEASTVVVIGLFVVELTVVPVIPTVEVSKVSVSISLLVEVSVVSTVLYKPGFDTWWCTWWCNFNCIIRAIVTSSCSVISIVFVSSLVNMTIHFYSKLNCRGINPLYESRMCLPAIFTLATKNTTSSKVIQNGTPMSKGQRWSSTT